MDIFAKRHNRNINRLLARIEKAFTDAGTDFAKLIKTAAMLQDGKTLFQCDIYTKKRADKIIARLNRRLAELITEGVKSEWRLADEKDDTLADECVGKETKGRLPKAFVAKWWGRNEKALAAFIKRNEGGMDVSQRVWNYCGAFRDEMEMALELGIKNGTSADELSRQIRQYLKEPKKLFRRVRDELGNLRLSKAAADYHPGRGVYRSSYMNARRLAATETNIAYRTEDHNRWGSLDFVVGYEVRLSNNHNCKGVPSGTYVDICDDLKGRYPKDFKFTGWHPHCRCVAIPITKTRAEMDADNECIMAGGVPSYNSENRVTQPPKGFSDWVKDNNEKLKKGKWPYFIADNRKYC